MASSRESVRKRVADVLGASPLSDEEGAVVVRTKVIKLSEDEWTAIGQGPSLVAAYGAEILFVVSDVEPALEDIGFVLRLDAPPLPVATQATIWGRACLGCGRHARVVLAPLTRVICERSPSPTNFGASQA